MSKRTEKKCKKCGIRFFRYITPNHQSEYDKYCFMCGMDKIMIEEQGEEYQKKGNETFKRISEEWELKKRGGG
jgi:uncharacterized Zn finger protein (UPF0148 family)